MGAARSAPQGSHYHADDMLVVGQALAAKTPLVMVVSEEPNVTRLFIVAAAVGMLTCLYFT